MHREDWLELDAPQILKLAYERFGPNLGKLEETQNRSGRENKQE